MKSIFSIIGILIIGIHILGLIVMVFSFRSVIHDLHAKNIPFRKSIDVYAFIIVSIVFFILISANNMYYMTKMFFT